jgi:S1-C subfamily serine protease
MGVMARIGRLRLGLLAIALAAGSAGLGAVLAQQRADIGPRPITPRGALAADELNNIQVFRQSSPSVVNITALGLSRDLFSMNVQQVPRGTGSGFHVIQGANGARVTLADQSSHRALLVGAFPDRDLAVLKIDVPRGKLPPIPIGSSRDLQVGQQVYAIGNPFGLDQTLTTGIVSALNREIESVTRRSIRGAIQTDAAINPGNSGGPLLDSAGRLIGVNTSIYSPSGASAGIGFAIPVDEVNRIVPRLIRDGRVLRPNLGITVAPEAWTRALQLPPGIALLRVAPGSVAQRAGLQPFSRNAEGEITAGDVLQSIDGEAVTSFDDMLTLLERRQPGDRVALGLWRSGKTRQVVVTLRDHEE